MDFFHAFARFVAVWTTMACFSWMLWYPLVGGTSSGRAWLFNFASEHHFEYDAKGGSILIFIGLPMLIAGTVCSLLAVQPAPPARQRRYLANLPRGLVTLLARAEQVVGQGRILKKVSRENNYHVLSFIFVFLPCAFFLGGSITRKGFAPKSLANLLGMLAVAASAFVLVPVSRQSPIYHALGINPLRAVRIHMWASYILSFGVVSHGTYWLVKETQKDGGFSRRFISPRQCWSLSESEHRLLSSSGCYKPFRNLTGLAAAAAVVLMASTSLYPVRRYWFRLFYVVHVISAPLVLIMTMMHYNRAVLYFAPGLIYYVASSFPVLMESFLKRFVSARHGVQVLAVDYLPGEDISNPRSCVSLTVACSDAAMQEYRSGMYVHVTVPEVAKSIAHPFTINRVPGEAHQLRIIFRAVGTPSAFTRRLAVLAKDSATSSASDHAENDSEHEDAAPFPPIFVDGFFGPPNRLQQILKHDTVVIVAGGIGITPYLSLMEDLVRYRATCTDPVDIHHVTLHWMCRDPQLIAYIQEEYFDPLRSIKSTSKSERISITIHNTCSRDPGAGSEFSDNTYSDCDDGDGRSSMEMASYAVNKSTKHHRKYFASMDERSYFTTSHFSSPSRSSIFGNLPSFFTFSAIAWPSLWYMWYAYSNLQHSSQVSQRSYSMILTVFLGLIVAAFVNVALMFLPAPSGHGRRPGSHRSLAKSHASDVVEDSSSDEDGIECANLNPRSVDHNLEDDYDVNTSGSSPFSSLVELNHRTGRPSLDEALSPLTNSDCPGLFYCAPAGLCDDLNKVLKSQRINSLPCMPSHVAIYEESFSI